MDKVNYSVVVWDRNTNELLAAGQTEIDIENYPDAIMQFILEKKLTFHDWDREFIERIDQNKYTVDLKSGKSYAPIYSYVVNCKKIS